MRASVRWIAPLALLCACGQAPEEGDAAQAPETAAPAPAPAATPDPAITSPVKSEAGITGEARVTPSEGGFQLALTLAGAPPGPHGWHIHQAPCGVSGAPIVVALSEKPDLPAVVGELEVAADGTANTTAQVPAGMLTVEQMQAGDFSLHVHTTGGAQHGPSIACVDL